MGFCPGVAVELCGHCVCWTNFLCASVKAKILLKRNTAMVKAATSSYSQTSSCGLRTL